VQLFVVGADFGESEFRGLRGRTRDVVQVVLYLARTEDFFATILQVVLLTIYAGKVRIGFIEFALQKVSDSIDCGGESGTFFLLSRHA
jgi:hypothetical protein